MATASPRLMSSAPKSLSNLFNNGNIEVCQRCQQRVYQAERVGPVNGVVFHKLCFKCIECEATLSLKTYFTNQSDAGDKNIYCSKHKPMNELVGFDASAIGIQNALRTPNTSNQFNSQILPTGHTPCMANESLNIAHNLNVQKMLKNQKDGGNDRHHYPAFVASKRKMMTKIHDGQEELEKKHRVEEDYLMATFKDDHEQQNAQLKKEIDAEWEVRLSALMENYESKDRKKNGSKFDKQTATKKLNDDMNKIHQEKKNIMVKTLRIKEQQDTKNLVAKQSDQMYSFLKQVTGDIKQEFTKEIDENMSGSEADQNAEQLNQLLQEVALGPSSTPPMFKAPNCRKRDLYYDSGVFKQLDEEVFGIAEKEQTSYTALVADLTSKCATDLEKARAIFRWITYKDLNVLEFDQTLDRDTPMGLLRGIKFGTETYTTLFKRLCSYAGLHCAEISGYAKSVGYEPGMKIHPDKFQNTWNAVMISGNWWPVQCNWGARYLVLNKESQDTLVRNKAKQDKIRYQYDEHYFLTDPDEFIREFWASDSNHQLLDKPITLQQFENMPYVRSIFFQYGLEFENPTQASLIADEKGGNEIKLKIPREFANDLFFQYELHFADYEKKDQKSYDGIGLERFVFHSIVDDVALFNIHVPCPGSYFLEIFSKRISELNQAGDNKRSSMKCACKIRIVCESMGGKFYPLPACCKGEWGPSKAQRLFDIENLVPSHSNGHIIITGESAILRFQMNRKLQFICKLHMNGESDEAMMKYVESSADDRIYTVRVTPPKNGQYGLDIFSRHAETDGVMLSHACKILFNVDRPKAYSPREGLGPTEAFKRLGLRMVTHPNDTMLIKDQQTICIEIAYSESLKMLAQIADDSENDCSDIISSKEGSKKTKFTLHLSSALPGDYTLSILAKRKQGANMVGVYKYLIRYQPDLDTLRRKKKGFFSKR